MNEGALHTTSTQSVYEGESEGWREQERGERARERGTDSQF